MANKMRKTSKKGESKMKKLCVFSYGLHPYQMTLETLAAMRGCGAVYTNSLDPASLPSFRKLTPGIKLTGRLSHRGTALEVAKGFSKHDKVGFLTYGNPLFLNRSAYEVIRAAREKKAEVEVLPAVSSLDALINIFDLNKYSPYGLRLVDAAASSDRHFFFPEMDTFIFVPYILNMPVCTGRKRKFLAAAAKAYAASAPVYLADCASISNTKTTVEKSTIAGLPALLEKLKQSHTLYFPAFHAGKRKLPFSFHTPLI
jgi:hypothetical protein